MESVLANSSIRGKLTEWLEMRLGGVVSSLLLCRGRSFRYYTPSPHHLTSLNILYEEVFGWLLNT